MIDADRSRIQTEFRIPVDSEYPGTMWIACLASDSEVPSDPELAVLRSYIEYAVGLVYNERWCRILLGDPAVPDDYDRNQHLARCAGHNTVAFVKRDGAWFYRRSTWGHGPWPFRYADGYEPMTLVALLDHICGYGDQPSPKWEAWKAERVDVFAALEQGSAAA